ncbi:hypothetical protein AOLI_G00262350 [Acnodon oligacanthus]
MDAEAQQWSPAGKRRTIAYHASLVRAHATLHNIVAKKMALQRCFGHMMKSMTIQLESITGRLAWAVLDLRKEMLGLEMRRVKLVAAASGRAKTDSQGSLIAHPTSVSLLWCTSGKKAHRAARQCQRRTANPERGTLRSHCTKDTDPRVDWGCPQC